jgi:hypothetical protein
MKIYDVEVPADLEIPELDEKKREEIDAIHDELERMEKESERLAAMAPYTAAQPLNSETIISRPQPSVNIEALRKLSPYLRAIFVYVNRAHVSY